MSSIINNIDNLLFESEIELDDKFIDIYEFEYAPSYGKRFTTKFGIRNDNSHDAMLHSGTKGAGNAAKTVDNSSDAMLYSGTKGAGNAAKTVSGAEHVAKKALQWATDNSTTIAAVSSGILGAALLAKYKNSIMRANYLVRHYSDLSAKARTPEQKTAANEKLKWAKEKLASAQAKARTEHKRFIEKSQEIKARIGQLNKAGDKAGAAKLQQKLDKRQKFLSKIGANI